MKTILINRKNDQTIATPRPVPEQVAVGTRIVFGSTTFVVEIDEVTLDGKTWVRRLYGRVYGVC